MEHMSTIDTRHVDAEDEDMYEADLPLSEEDVLERYAHTNWEAPHDDHIMAEVGYMLWTPYYTGGLQQGRCLLCALHKMTVFIHTRVELVRKHIGQATVGACGASRSLARAMLSHVCHLQHLRYMRKSQTPVKMRKCMHEEMEEPSACHAPYDAPARTSRPFVVVCRGPVQASQCPPKRQKEKRKPKDGGPCTNCGTTVSSMWRPHNSKCACLLLPSSCRAACSARFWNCSYL